MIFSPNRLCHYLGDDESLLNARQCSAEIDSGSGGDSSDAIAAAGVAYFTGGKTVVAGAYGFSAVTTKISCFNCASSLVPGADITVARRALAGYGNADKGYFSGGCDDSSGGPTTPAAQDVSTSWSTVTDRLTYSTDVTAAVPGADLVTAKEGPAGVGNADKGFISGGRTAVLTYVVTADKNTYSTETTTAVSGADLSVARAFLAAAGDLSGGWFVSGGGPGLKKTTDKTTYSTETTANVPAADIAGTLGRLYIGAGGNLETAYFVGGIGWVKVDVLTYATETMAVGAETPLTLSAGGCAGNLLGGYLGSDGIMRMDYLTGVAHITSANVLPVGSVHVAAVGTGIFT